ncbi:hypothetical protein GCM10027614_57340 [Micromonospora vulcania]
MTRLPNRRRITGALEESVKIRAPGEVVALLLFDVDGLRQVNESLGHAAGDKVLAEVAARLRASAPSSALVGRAGGDEFLVTLRLESADEALELAGQLRDQIRDEMVFDALTLDVNTAVGVAVHPDHGSDAATLLLRVDLAATAPSRCRAACSCSTRGWSPGRCTGWASPAICGVRWTRASWRSTSSPR